MLLLSRPPTYNAWLVRFSERLLSMNIRNVIRGLGVWAGLSALVLLLFGCAVGMAADIVSVGTTGKSITDHVLDVVTGKDCNLFQAAWRSDRDVCEPRQTEVTTRDIKELPDPGHSPEGRSADPSLAAVPSVGCLITSIKVGISTDC